MALTVSLSRGAGLGARSLLLGRCGRTLLEASPAYRHSLTLTGASSTQPLRQQGTASLNDEFLVSMPGIKARVLDGKKLAKTIRSEIASEVKTIKAKGNRPPNLVAVLVGEDPASKTYISNKTKAAKGCGIDAMTIKKDKSITQDHLLGLVDELNNDDSVDGILVQLPLPPHINEKLICNSVTPNKDVDGFHTHNIGKYCAGEPALIPATPLGILEIIKRCNIPTFGRHLCMVGRSKNIGFTLITLLHSDGTGDATATMCHRYTPPEQLPVMTSLADIVIVATGIPGLIKAHMIKDGAAVIDIGINRIVTDDGSRKIVGDVEFEAVGQKASLVTPVPGGVGPLTVSMLMKNTLRAAQKDFDFDFKSIKA